MNEIVILADRFNYFGKSPLKIPKEILDFFPMGERARMNGNHSQDGMLKMDFIIRKRDLLMC